MKHRRLFGLLSAAAVALGSVPVLPVFAADAESSAYSSSISKSDGFFCISSRRGTEGTEECSHDAATGAFSYKWNGVQNGFFCYGPDLGDTDKTAAPAPDVSFAGTLELGDYGFYGVGGTVSDGSGFANFRIIEGWGMMSNVRQRAGEKLGDITVGDTQYEVFRSAANGSGSEQGGMTYWSISNCNQFDAPRKYTVEGTVPVAEHLAKMEAFGLPYQQYGSVGLFVDTGEKEDGKVSGSADFTKNTYTSPAAGTNVSETGVTDDGYAWWHDRFSEGMSSFIPYEDGAFRAKWINASYVSIGCGHEFSDKPAWNEAGNLRYEYACSTKSTGSGFFGVEGWLNSPAMLTEFFIVDGWTGKRPPVTETGELLGTISVYGTQYDVYFLNMTQESLAGTSPYLYEFWSVRKENGLTSNGNLSNLVAVDAHLAEWNKLAPSKLAKNLGRITAFASSAWEESNAEIGFSINRLLTDPGTYTGRYCCETGKEDGYTWTRVQKGLGGTSDIQPGKNGNICANWQLPADEEAVLFTSGIKTDRIQDNANLTELTGSYTVGCSISGDAFFGLASTFMDISPSDHEPDTVECYVIDGWGTERPAFDAKYKLGTIAVDGEDSSYDVYLLPVTADTADSAAIIPLRTTKQQCMIVRQESKYRTDGSETVTASHDMVKIINTVKALGVDFPAWRDSAFFVQANSGMGSVEAIRNSISYAYLNDDPHEFRKTGQTPDGYTWEQWVAAGDAGYKESKMNPGTAGKFSCSWKDARDARHSLGLQFPDGTPWDSVGDIRCDYALNMESDDVVYAGIYGYLTGYTTEFYIIDAWIGTETLTETLKQGFNITELGTITANGAVYDSFVGYYPQMDINGTRAIPQYYAIRRENLAANGGTVSGSTDVTAFLSAWKALGMDAPDLALVTLLVEGGCFWGDPSEVYSGKAEVTKNAFTVGQDEKTAQSLMPSVKGDATCDGRLDISDAVLVARVVNEDTSAVITDQGIRNGDVDGKSGLNPEDITVLLQAIAKKIKL